MSCPYEYDECPDPSAPKGSATHKLCYEETGAWVPDARFEANPLTAAYEVVATGSARKVNGVLLDHFTAQAIVQVGEALSPESRAKLERMDIVRAATIVWKLAKR